MRIDPGHRCCGMNCRRYVELYRLRQHSRRLPRGSVLHCTPAGEPHRHVPTGISDITAVLRKCGGMEGGGTAHVASRTGGATKRHQFILQGYHHFADIFERVDMWWRGSTVVGDFWEFIETVGIDYFLQARSQSVSQQVLDFVPI